MDEIERVSIPIHILMDDLSVVKSHHYCFFLNLIYGNLLDIINGQPHFMENALELVFFLVELTR